VVIQLNETHTSGISELPPAQAAAYNAVRAPAQYTVQQLKADVERTLRVAFPGSVNVGTKAIHIGPAGARRPADVLVAIKHKEYHQFTNFLQEQHAEGLSFFDAFGNLIVNYPRIHSENLTAKHQATNQWFKPTVRIFKNMRTRMVADRIINDGTAPSHFIECMLYNVPDNLFGTNYAETVLHSMRWLLAADRTQFLTASRMHWLLYRNDPRISWPAASWDAFLNGVSHLWNNWQ
jgi:hypothetical protein